MTGCPDVHSPPGAWSRREGDTVTIGCVSDDKTWTLKCENDRWVGVFGKCAPVTTTTTEKSVKGREDCCQHQYQCIDSDKQHLII